MDLKECEAFHSRLNQQRIDAEGCDVNLVSLRDGKEFMAHLNVLTAASPHFKRVFHSNFKEPIVGKIELDMDSDIIEMLLKYMYTYAIQIDESIASRLFPEASYLQLNTLKKRCAKYLLSNVTRSNCIEMWSFACLYTCEEMKDLAWKMMCRNFDSLIDTPEFLGLDKNDLHTLLADKSLRCRESSVFSGVCNWVRADPGNRKRHMKELFSLVRLSCLKKDYLVGTVGKEPLVTENKACVQIYHHCLEDIVVRGPRPCRDRRMTMPWKAIGGWTDGPQLGVDMKCCSTVVFDDKIYCASNGNQMAVFSQGNWRLFASPSTGVFWNLCVVSDSMYAIGVSGKDDNYSLFTRQIAPHPLLVLAWTWRNVYKFEKGSETWTLVHSAQGNSEKIVAVTTFNGRICVADERTGAIEAFDPTNAGSGFVQLCAFPHYFSKQVSLSVVDGRLMTVGVRMGTDHYQVYVWNPQTDSWNAETPLGEIRECIGATVCDGRLVIVIFGRNDRWQNKQDVQMLVDGEWKQLPSLKHRRGQCGLAVLDNVLYAIGGSSDGTSLKVEMLRLEEE